MLKLAHEGKAIDKVTLLADNYEYIQQLGGPGFITEIETKGNIENFDSYEREFIDRYKKSESENIAKQWLSKKEKEPNEVISQLQSLDELGITEERDKNDVLKEFYNLPFIENATEAGIPS